MFYLSKCTQNSDFGYKITVIPLYQNDGYFLSMGYEKDIFRNFAYDFELSHKNEILACARTKSANADEIFGFASDEIKSTHPAVEPDFIQWSWISSLQTISPTRKGGFSWKRQIPVGICRFLAEDEGFEPPQTESESGVLPLHKSSVCQRDCARHVDYYTHFPENVKHFFAIFQKNLPG